MNSQILLHTDTNQQLQEDGYACIPFLNSTEVKQLEELFLKHNDTSGIGSGLYSNLYALSGDTNWEVSCAMENICNRAFNENFTNASLNGGVFIAKGANEDTRCHLHQDYTNTDESIGATYAIWIPLCGIDESTGLFNVIPGSHKYRQHVRAITNQSFYLELEKVKPERLKKLTAKAGEAIIFDHALIHGSEANKSNKLRIAAVLGVVPSGVEYQYYLKTGENTFSVYRLDKEFFIRRFKENIGPNNFPQERFIKTLEAPVTMEPALAQSFLK